MFLGLKLDKELDRKTKIRSLQNCLILQIAQKLDEGAQRFWHDEQKVPWLIHRDEWWSYDDPESVKHKVFLFRLGSETSTL